jgi:hypothetical protein
MNYSDSSTLADIGAPRHRRGRRLVLYLSLTLFVPLFVGLAVLLGASAPAKTPPQSPGVETRVPSPDMPQALREPEPLLALKAEDVPLLRSLRERQRQLDEHDKQLATAISSSPTAKQLSAWCSNRLRISSRLWPCSAKR